MGHDIQLAKDIPRYCRAHEKYDAAPREILYAD